MSKFKCQCGETKDIYKFTTIIIDFEWVIKESKCKCGKYMEIVIDKSNEGFPTIIPNDTGAKK